MTNYFLSLSGFECPDERVTRLVSLATHKFVADLTNDALQHCKARQQARTGKSQGADARIVLTTKDLANSCKEWHPAAQTRLLRRHARASRSRPDAITDEGSSMLMHVFSCIVLYSNDVSHTAAPHTQDSALLSFPLPVAPPPSHMSSVGSPFVGRHGAKLRNKLVHSLAVQW